MKTSRAAQGIVRVETSKYALEMRPAQALAHLRVKGASQQELFFPGGACNPVGKRDGTRC